MSNSPLKILFICIFVLKVALVLFVFYWFGQEKFIWADSVTYSDLAQKLALGEGYNDPIRTPLYPFLLSLLMRFSSNAILYMSILQAFISSVIALLIWRIGIIFVSNRAALAIALITVFEPLSAIFNVLILPETFLLLFLLLFIYFFLRYMQQGSYGYLATSAFALVLAILTKPVATYLFFLPLAVLLWRKTFWHFVFFALLILALLLPWMIYNEIAFGNFGVSSHGDANVCGYLLTSVFSTEHGTDPSNMDQNLFPESFKDARRRCTSTVAGLKIAVLKYPQSFAKVVALSSLSYLTNDGYSVLFQKLPEDSIKAHHNYLTPAVFADREWPTKIILAARELGKKNLVIVLLGKIFWFFVALLAVVGALYLIHDQKKRLLTLFLVFIILYFICVSVLSTGYGVGARLRYPIEPILLIFAFSGVKKLSTSLGVTF